MSSINQGLDSIVAAVLNGVSSVIGNRAANASGGTSGTGSFGQSAPYVGAQNTTVPSSGIERTNGQPGTGFSNPNSFGSSAKAAIYSGMASIAASTNEQDAMNLDMFTNRTRAFGTSGTTYLDVFKMQREMANGGTVTSPLDAPQALANISMAGMAAGTQQFGATARSARQISNIMPGLGEAAGANAAMQMQNPQAVNLGNAIGIHLRDMKTGKISSVGDIANQIWDKMKMYKRDPGPITEEDLTVALMPGGSVDSLLNQLIQDPTLKEAIVAMLYARAKGVGPKYSKKALRRAGFSTETAQSLSESNASKMEYNQSTSGAVLAGIRGGLGIDTAMRNFATALNDAIPVLSAIAGLSSFTNQFRAEGGPVTGNKTYIVGEKGPEVFVPSENGYIVPNKKLKSKKTGKPLQSQDPTDEDGNSHAPRYMSKKEVREWIVEFLRQLSVSTGKDMLTQKNISAWGRVAQHEGGGTNNRAAYNPFNTTYDLNGSWSMNDVGVQGYWTKQDGITATINTLKTKGVGYKRLLNAMANPNTTEWQVLKAFSASRWGGTGDDNTDWHKYLRRWDKNTIAPEEGLISTHGYKSKNGSEENAKINGIDGSFTSFISSMNSGSTLSGIPGMAGLKPGAGGYAQASRDAFQAYIQNLAMTPTFNKRQFGGQVTAGAHYLVGEDGPEQFISSSTGKANYGGVTIYISADKSYDEHKLARLIKDTLHEGNIIKKAGGF